MNSITKFIHIILYLILFLNSGYAGPLSTERVGHLSHSLTKTKIYKILKKKLPKRFRHQASIITQTIMKEATASKIDAMMITAVISGESSFNPVAIGPVGEIGLMQLRESTAKWIAQKKEISWRGRNSLKNPSYNIRIGVAYLSYLKERFSPHGGLLYLAAYNMGETSLLRLLSKKIRPNTYPNHVMKNYLAIN